MLQLKKMTNKKKGPSVETERPLTIACHMKKFKIRFNESCQYFVG